MAAVAGGAQVSQLKRLEHHGDGLIAGLITLSVRDAETYTQAAEGVKLIDLYLKEAHEWADPSCDASYQAWQIALEQRRKLVKPCEDLRRVLVDRMGAWEQRERDRQRAAEEAARREQERLDREAREAAEAEQARLLKAAEDQRIEHAATLEARGDAEAATRLLEQPLRVAAVVPPPTFVPAPPVSTVPTLAGVSSREAYDFKVTNEALIPRQYLMIDAAKVRQVVRALGMQANIPGIRVIPKRTPVLRKERR